MKKFFLLALSAATMFASCSKQDKNGTDDNAGKVSLSVKIDMSKLTRSSDGNIYDATNPVPTWANLLLVVTKADGTFVTEKTYTKAEYGALTDGKADLIEKGTTNLTGGKVTAYITTVGNTWGILSADPTKNLPIIASEQKNINSWQASGFIKTNIAGTFENVPYHGEGGITKAAVVNTDGHELLEATITLTPELGRIQVIKSPQTGGEINGVTVSQITVSNVYINKVSSDDAVVDIRTENGGVNVDKTTWKDEFYGPDKPLVGMKDNATDKGYQIFDQNTPHVIVEIKYKLTQNGVEGEELIGYLTIDKFTYDGMTSGDLTVDKGNIYNIDLSKLKPTYDKIGDDPYDNTVYYDLIATVTVKEWVTVAVTPGL